MEEKKEEVRDTPRGYCYRGRNCPFGDKCSNSKVTEQGCRDLPLDCKSWKNDDTGECVNL